MQKSSDQEKSNNYYAKKFSIRVLNSTLSTRQVVWKKIAILTYWLQMTWIPDLTRRQEIIILENLDWLTKLGTNQKLTQSTPINYFNVYTEWMKRMIQRWQICLKLTIKFSIEHLMVSLWCIYCQIWTGLATNSSLETFLLLTLNMYQSVVHEQYLNVQCILLYRSYVAVEKQFV